MAKVVMSWGECKVEIAPYTDGETFPTDWTKVGLIKDKTTTVNAAEGTKLEATISGGTVIDELVQEGGFTVETTVIEPSFDLYVQLGLGTMNGKELDVTTHIPNSKFSVKVTPKVIGGTGIKALKSSVSVSPLSAEDEGQGLKLSFKLLPIFDDEYTKVKWYTKFKTAAAAAGG